MIRERFSIAGEDKLNRPELEIIKILAKWDYNVKRPTLRNLSYATNYSYSYISMAVSNLKERGLIKKSMSGVIHLDEDFRARVLAEMDAKEKGLIV